jgi:hypothetical protein
MANCRLYLNETWLDSNDQIPVGMLTNKKDHHML